LRAARPRRTAPPGVGGRLQGGAGPHRPAVPRRGGGGDDHARAGRHHDRLHRVSRPGPLGATAAALGVFLPCYLFVIIPAPYFRRFADNPKVRAFVDGVTAAATGAIAGAAFVLGRRALVDVTTVLMAVATWLIFSRFKKVPEP